jgi:hypothetical protein
MLKVPPGCGEGGRDHHLPAVGGECSDWGGVGGRGRVHSQQPLWSGHNNIPHRCGRSVKANEGPPRIQYKCLVLIYVFPEMKRRGFLFPKQNYTVLYPNFHIHVPLSDLYIPRIGLSILLQPNLHINPGNMWIAHKYMDVRIENKATQFNFWEYKNRIFGTVWFTLHTQPTKQFTQNTTIFHIIVKVLWRAEYNVQSTPSNRFGQDTTVFDIIVECGRSLREGTVWTAYS